MGSQGILDVEDGPDGYLYASTTDAIYRVNATGAPPPGATGLPLAPILAAIGLAVVALLFLIAVVRERRRRVPPPGPPAAPPPP